MRQTDEAGDAMAAAGEAGGSGRDDNRSSVEETDPFDPERLRKAYARPDFVGVKRAITRVLVKKPEKYWSDYWS